MRKPFILELAISFISLVLLVICCQEKQKTYHFNNLLESATPSSFVFFHGSNNDTLRLFFDSTNTLKCCGNMRLDSAAAMLIDCVLRQYKEQVNDSIRKYRQIDYDFLIQLL